MNVWAVTYEFNGTYKTLLVESEASVRSEIVLHPAIASKAPNIEFVGTLA